MPYSGDGLLSSYVPKVETFDKSDHVRGVRGIPSVDVTSFCGVSEEGRIS